MCGLSQRQRPRYRIIVRGSVNTESAGAESKSKSSLLKVVSIIIVFIHILACVVMEVGQHQASAMQLEQLSLAHRVFSCCSCSLFII
jgi:hypothetical protein